VRSLEGDGLLTRSVTPSVPVRVDYELTPLGQNLMPLIAAIKSWGESHMTEVNVARATYDEVSAGASVGVIGRQVSAGWPGTSAVHPL